MSLFTSTWKIVGNYQLKWAGQGSQNPNFHHPRWVQKGANRVTLEGAKRATCPSAVSVKDPMQYKWGTLSLLLLLCNTCSEHMWSTSTLTDCPLSLSHIDSSLAHRIYVWRRTVWEGGIVAGEMVSNKISASRVFLISSPHPQIAKTSSPDYIL